MKGYLSRIARQSGLRFSLKSVISPDKMKESQAKPLMQPLDHQETVIVPPPIKSKSSAAKALKHGKTSERLAAENIPLKPDRTKMMSKFDPEPVLAPPAPETSVSPTGEETVIVMPEPEISRKKKTLSSDENPVAASSRSMPAEIQQPVLEEPAKTTEPHKKQAPGPNSVLSTESKAKEKQHFAKTAEIIGGREAEPAEVHTILLREVQEWAAADPAPEIAEGSAVQKALESVAMSSETIETKKVGRTTERDAGVVRITEKHKQASIPQGVPRIDEQSFDLSIGTISVIIEGDERPPQPALTPGADNRQNRHDSGPKRSRLERNYL